MLRAWNSVWFVIPARKERVQALAGIYVLCT